MKQSTDEQVYWKNSSCVTVILTVIYLKIVFTTFDLHVNLLTI